MTEEKNLLARNLYQNEAFLEWTRVKEDLPDIRHMDVVSDGSELRIFLFADGGMDPTVSFINFGVEDGNMLDASYIMRNYHYTDFYPLDKEEAAVAWAHYKCQEFIDSGAQFDESKTELYNLLIGKNRFRFTEE